MSLDRRQMLQATAVAGLATVTTPRSVRGSVFTKLHTKPGFVSGRMTGAQALAESLRQECVGCVFGIPGAQENELWDEFKSREVPYLWSAHEYGASCMADGYARATGKPGVLCIVPGPGITNALTGLGEALLDSVPIVAIVGDVAGGEKYRPFQVHSLDTCALLAPVTKCVFPVNDVRRIAHTVREAFRAAVAGEPGPVAVVIPYQLFIEVAEFHSPPLPAPCLPFDEDAARRAIGLLADKKLRVGIYAGLGCMDHGEQLTRAAELLQAPVATSVSGKGAISEVHPLAVGWGFGPHASIVAERAFERDPLHPFKSGIDLLLAIGVKFSEVSTGFYGNPRPKTVIHVDINPRNLGKVMAADVCVHADAGLFLDRLLECHDSLRRSQDHLLQTRIRAAREERCRELSRTSGTKCGVHPLSLIAALRRKMPEDGLFFVDVTASEHWAAEHYTVCQARTYFNPTDNQAMGWSIGASIGAQRAFPCRTTAALMGDGCFLMALQEFSTAAREGLAVKGFILDDHAYHYMQMLQQNAYHRTTATHLARLDYSALAQGLGVDYREIRPCDDMDASVDEALQNKRPTLVRVVTDYADKKIRWIEAVRKRYFRELSPAQKTRILARLGGRTIHEQKND